MSDKVPPPPPARNHQVGVIMGRAAVSTVAPPLTLHTPSPQSAPLSHFLCSLISMTSEPCLGQDPPLRSQKLQGLDSGFGSLGSAPRACSQAGGSAVQQGLSSHSRANEASVAVVTWTQPGVGALGLPFPESPLSPLPPLMAGP